MSTLADAGQAAHLAAMSPQRVVPVSFFLRDGGGTTAVHRNESAGVPATAVTLPATLLPAILLSEATTRRR